MTFQPLDTLDDVPRMLADLNVPGMSFAWATGTDIVADAWGAAHGGTPVTPDTLFQAGSVAKPVIAFAALRLARQGRLDLDADVNTILTSWRVPPVGQWQPVVTTRMLLAHLSGAGDSTGEGYRSADQDFSLIDGLEGAPFRMWSVPNLMASYSPIGYVLIAQVVCDVTRLQLQAAMQSLVFGSLGMSSTTFEQPLSEPCRVRAAHGHRRGEELDGGWLTSPAAMWTTPSDLMRLAQAINAGSEPEMLRGHPVEPSMGLGLFLTSHEGVDWWSHGGSVPGYECTLVGSTSGGRPFAAVAMTNASEGTLPALDALRVVSTERGPGPIVLRHVSTVGREAWARMTAVNSQAAGRYLLPSGFSVALDTTPKPWGQNELMLTLPGQRPIELSRVTDGMWRVPGFESYVMFDPPDTIRFLQAGREVRAERVR